MLGAKWYEHPQMLDFKKSVEKYYNEIDEFFSSLGYEHIKGTGSYKVTKPSDERIALFAHEGFCLTFLSAVLDIPYPAVCMHFGMSHTGMTVINFEEEDGYCVPRLLMLSSDSHLYKEGLPTRYYNEIQI